MACKGMQRCTCAVVAGAGTSVTGNGSPANPYIINAGAAECADVRGCFSAGDGAGYDPATGVITGRVSTDAGNTTGIGGDGGLYTPGPAAPVLPLVGCGLTGDGTTEAPITVVPQAGEEAWPWPCDATVNSTLKCDPDTGALWTPPEHTSVSDSIYQEHFPTGLPPIGVQGWGVIDPDAFARFDIPANFLSDCRFWSWTSAFTGYIDVTVTATTTFEVGWAMSINGEAPFVRPLWSRLTAPGAARREMNSGTSNATGNQPVGETAEIVVYPALHVVAGAVTINSWLSDSVISLSTQ